ncbi:NRDE family protein [bacterium]|nr:MAG: NRDE family protein [bacterium]
MCLILLAYRAHPEYPVIIAANRDEFYERRTAHAAYWDDNPEILAGKDLQGGGTWLGVSKSGRIAMITNYREPGSFNQDAPTRGKLVSDFLSGKKNAMNYLQQVKHGARSYNGFNLILGDDSGFYYFSNRSDKINQLPCGVFGLSNHLLDTPWPKVEKSKNKLMKSLEQTQVNENELFAILSDVTPANDAQLPDTGVGVELEKMLSPVFIKSPKYGTRCSTIILIDKKLKVSFVERTYAPEDGRWTELRYELNWRATIVS